MLENYIDVIEDLSCHLSPQVRYQRLLEAIARTIPCDAVALLRLQNKALRPLAVLGLRPETLGRRFELSHHPRLAHILSQRVSVRFQHDSNLPDPYDGLIDAADDQPHVHDCMGISIYMDDQPWGVITLDALQPGRFSQVSLPHQQAVATLTRAVIAAAQRIELLEKELARGHDVTAELNREQATKPLIGRSEPMRQLRRDMEAVAATPLSVLLQGETGVGKEVVARHLHLNSDRFDQPFVQVNCAALPETLAESELFGHTEGAFTGAGRSRSGRFELAHAGTLFLDEVGELPLSVQAKMLRALQEGELQRIGGDEPVQVDVRVIAATNRDLQEELKQGRFRADLYHRLNVYPIIVPPLRNRGADILELAEYFLERNQSRLNIQKLVLSPASREALCRHSWPGNIRELEHVLSRAALQARQRQGSTSMVELEMADLAIQPESIQLSQPPDVPVTASGQSSMASALDEFRRELVRQRLEQSNDNMAAAARSLKMDRSNLLRLMRRLGLDHS